MAEESTETQAGSNTKTGVWERVKKLFSDSAGPVSEAFRASEKLMNPRSTDMMGSKKDPESSATG